MVENSVLRENSRGQLGGKLFGELWLMMLLACFIVAALEGVAGFTYVGTIIVLGPLSYGLCRVLVKRVKNEGKVELGDLFDGFKEAFTDSLLLGLLQSIFVFLWSLLLVIPGIVKSYSYAMSSFIQQDSPNKNWKQCLDASIDMMNGNKMQLFLLDLSFLGWYILGALCFGVGTLFVIPYHQMARANFYMALVAERENNAARYASANAANGQWNAGGNASANGQQDVNAAANNGSAAPEAPAASAENAPADPFADVAVPGQEPTVKPENPEAPQDDQKKDE